MDKRPTGLCQNPLITGVMCVGLLLAAIGCDAGGASNAKPRFAPPNAAQDGSQEALNMDEMVRNGKLLASGQKLSDFRLKLFLDKAAPGDIREVLASNNLLTSTGVKTIMSAASTSSMTTLYLNNNAVGNEGLAAVASSPRLANLQWLQLSAVKADTDGIKSLASAEHVPADLKGLTLSHNAVSDAGAQALATMKWPGSVELVQCKIGGQGARELIQKTSWKALNLSDNPIGPGGLDGLSGVSASLSDIMLDKCKLGDGGVKALAAQPAPALRVLSLRYNGLTDAGIDALIAAPWLSTLKTLTLTAHGASSKARQRLIDAWGQRPGLNVAAP